MTHKTAEVELNKEKAALVLKLIDRANRLGDEIKLVQSLIKSSNFSEREAQVMHDELDIVRDYREVTLERIALITLGDQKPVTPNDPAYQPVGLGTLGEDEDECKAKGWDAARKAMFEASAK